MPFVPNSSTDEKTKTDLMSQLLDSFNGDCEEAIDKFEDFVKNFNASHQQPKKANRQFEEVVLAVKNVTRKYKLGRQNVNALQGVSFDVYQGEIVAITGASGSGKSTLLQLIGGLDKPTSGELLIGGTNLAKLSDRQLSQFRLRTVGFVFQFFYLQPFLKLQDNLEIPAMFAGRKKQDRRHKVQELATKVGLSDRLEHYPKELSGGQMQRAAIARALLNQPKIILADEPTGNLDMKNGQAIISLFEEIRDQFNTTIVLVTHDMTIANRADRIIKLKDGRIDD